MLFSKVSLADYFFNSRHALTIAAKNPRIQPLIAEYNVTSASIDVGIAKLDELMAADKKKTEARGKQLELRVALEELFAEVHPVYMSHVKLAKVKFQRFPERVARLMLLEPRKTRINDWLRQADTFYSNLVIDSEMVSRFATNSITLEKLDDAHGRVKEVERANNAYQEAKGLAQAVLEARDVLLEDFEAWMKEFITLCKIALRKDPQLLEALGIMVLSKGYVRTKSEEELPPGQIPVKKRALKTSTGNETGVNEQTSTGNLLPAAVQVEPGVQEMIES